MRRLAWICVCAIVVAGCGASHVSRVTQTSTANPLVASGAVNGLPTLSIEPPLSVKRAGGKQLDVFYQGRDVVNQSGCLACHRIGGQGPDEPGPALTYIGSLMPARTIERVLIDAEPPMPSFAHLPRAKFRALIHFLTLLRCPGQIRGLSPHGCTHKAAQVVHLKVATR
jgi:mono/diheme cytochrome c family protein